MKQSIGLGIVLGLGLGISSQAVRGDPPVPVPISPPDCGSCDCATSKAWRNTNDAAGYYVATTRPLANPDSYGDPVSYAHWTSSNVWVYSSACLQDYHDYADTQTYNYWKISNVSWADNCTRLQGQTGGGWVVVAVGTGGNQDPLGTDRRYDCGAQ